MSIQLEKRGFYLNVYYQDTKNPRFPAPFFILFPRGTVRCLLCPFFGGRPGQDLYRRSLGRPGNGLWAKRGRKGLELPLLGQGQAALMFLKNYSGLSDRKLLEHLNGNLDWQFFCDIYLRTERLDNFKIISEIRCELAGKLGMDRVQQALYGHWSPHIDDKGSITMDATCY